MLIYERSATNIRDWSLAYSFICTHISSQFSGVKVISTVEFQKGEVMSVDYAGWERWHNFLYMTN